MRIISGTHKGRAFHPPKNLPVRPTTDFGKEALFNILTNRIDFSLTKALDLFSGTGSMSYELASRGCEDIVCVDSSFYCYSFIKKTAEEFGFKGIRAIKNDVYKFLKSASGEFNLIFADPPFESKETISLPEIIFERKLLAPNGLLIVEHPKDLDFSNTERFLEQRNYSKINFSLFT